MLEAEIKELFESQVAQELPAWRISIPAVHHIARQRLRLRRTLAVASPLLAAATVLGVLLSGSVLAGTGTAPPAPASQLAPPQEFSPTRPYVRLSWLPGHSVVWKYILWPAEEYVETSGRDAAALNLFARGQCPRRGATVTCAGWAVNRKPAVGEVGGRPVYAGKNVYGRTLSWQYAADSWAQLDIGSAPVGTALRIARGARFGPAVADPMRFPYQVTGEPAGWAVAVSSRWTSHHIVQQYVQISGHAGSNLNVPGITEQPAGTMQTCQRLIDYPARWYRMSYTTAKGIPAMLSTGVAGSPVSGVQSLCAPDADGVLLELQGGHRSSMVDLFDNHLRLLGANHAHWTTEPLG
jgi:hypothetical protein